MSKNLFEQLHDVYKKFISRKGVIEFTTGEYEIFVHVKIKGHERVCFNIETEDHHTCGYVDDNTFLIEKNDHGFILFAKVESNKVKFYWHIE